MLFVDFEVGNAPTVGASSIPLTGGPLETHLHGVGQSLYGNLDRGPAFVTKDVRVSPGSAGSLGSGYWNHELQTEEEEGEIPAPHHRPRPRHTGVVSFKPSKIVLRGTGERCPKVG